MILRVRVEQPGAQQVYRGPHARSPLLVSGRPTVTPSRNVAITDPTVGYTCPNCVGDSRRRCQRSSIK